MADPIPTTPLEKELNDFREDFISPKDPWRNSDTLRETDYSNLKRRFDKYQENDSLIQSLKGRDPPLLQSVVKSRHRCWERLKVLLESREFDIDVPDSDGRTAFSHAAEFHDATSMRLLLEHNANPNSKDENGWTPLMWVAKGMYYFKKEAQLNLIMRGEKMIDFMCTKGADINCQDTSGQTALMLAAKGMRHDLIKILIGKKADASMTDVAGHTWFWWLLKSRQQSKPREQDIDPNDPVFRMVPGIDSSSKETGGRTLLSWAVEFQDMAMVKALLDGNADANDYDKDPPDPVLKIPFLRALESDNIVLASLFTNVIVVDPQNESLDIYVEKDNHSLHTLVQGLDDIDEERALNLLQKMSQVPYNINQMDNIGKSPLHHAAELRKERFALAILQQLKLKDLGEMDDEGKTPLFYAIKNRMTNLVRELVREGADIDLSLDWSQLGAGYIRFTLDTCTEFEFMNGPPNEQDCIPSAGKKILCFYGKDNWPWLSKTRQHTYLNFTRMGSSQAGRTISQIVAFFPRKENRFELGDFWAIGCVTHAKQFGFATTIRSTRVPDRWEYLCKHFVKQLLHSWESLCDDESQEIEKIREKQLEKQGKSGLIIKRLAKNTLNRAELRRCHQQHVSGLVRAFKSDANLGPSHKTDLIARMDQLKDSVGARLDQLEQASKELLQIEFAWVSISEAASIKRISLVTFIFLPLMFASSLFGMNVDVLANNPDWRWYVVIGASSLILTLVIWIAFRFFSTEDRVDESRHWVDESRHWVYACCRNTLWMTKLRMNIKTRWSRHQQKIPDAEMPDTELKV